MWLFNMGKNDVIIVPHNYKSFGHRHGYNLLNFHILIFFISSQFVLVGKTEAQLHGFGMGVESSETFGNSYNFCWDYFSYEKYSDHKIQFTLGKQQGR